MVEIKEFANLSPEERELKKRLLSKPVEAIDPTSTKTVSDLLHAYQRMSVQARNLGKCLEVYENMLSDTRRPVIFLGLAGPLIAGGLRETIRTMIEEGLVDVVVSTGAIMYQDIYQARGYKHYIGTPNSDDAKLRDLYIDRIYDTYVDEEKFIETDTWIGDLASSLEPRGYSSREFMEILGKHLNDEKSIVATAAKVGVPIFVPAINDSSIGIGLTSHYRWAKVNGKPRIYIDSIRDNYELTQIVVKYGKTAAIYVAGGVPKNFINDSVVMGYVFNVDTGGHLYAFQLTTDAPHWGGLSGSTLEEATSWGKIAKKATRATAYVDPMVSLPLLVTAVIQDGYGNKRPRLKMVWNNDELISIEKEN
ncbi:MAG: deoxyhypusine synthase family protein [Thermoprotei archaeon]|jgi:deoxyhypusine synthase